MATKSGNRVNGAILPAGETEVFSKWIQSFQPTITTGENPEQTTPHVRQGHDIAWEEIADFYMKEENKTKLKQISNAYFSDYGNVSGFLLQFMDYEQTQEERYFKNKIKIDQSPWSLGVWKTPGQTISSMIERIEGQSTYTQEGFDMDMKIVRTEMGRQEWDAKYENVVGDIYAYMTWELLNCIVSTPQAARTADQRYPNRSKPTTTKEVFADEQRTFMILNKDKYGYQSMIRDANVVFSQFKVGGVTCAVTDLVVSSPDRYYIRNHNEMNVRSDMNGDNNIMTKADLGFSDNVNGVNIVKIPLVDVDFHNNADETLLMTQVATGSQAVFLDKTHVLNPGEFRSWMRDIEYVSLETDKFDNYPFVDFLSHVPHFHPVANDDECTRDMLPQKDMNNNHDGGIDVELLKRLVTAASKRDADNLFTKTNTRSQGNEGVVDPLLRPVDNDIARPMNSDGSMQWGTDGSNGTWFVNFFMGELHEDSCKTAYLAKISESFYHYIYQDLNENEMRDWTLLIGKLTTGVNITEPPYHAAAEKIINRLYQCTYKHPFFEPTSSTTAKAGIIEGIMEFINQMRTKDLNVITDKIAKEKGLFNAPFSKDDIKIKAAAAKGEYNEETKDTQKWNELPEWKRHTLQYPLFVPDKNSDISTFAYRFHRSFNMSPDRMFAEMVMLFFPLNINGFRKLHNCNINIPLGGRNIRLRETQFMMSMIALAMAPGKLGTMYHGGFDAYIDWHMTYKHLHFSMDTRFGFLIPNNEQIQIIEYVRGGSYVGGSDNKYANLRDLAEPRNSFGIDGQTFINNLHTNGSNIAVLGSYNEAVEGTEDSSTDVRGRYYRHDFIGRLDNSAEFNKERDTPMYSGQFMVNLLLKFERFENEQLTEMAAARYNFPQRAALRRTNYHLHNTSVRRYDGRTNGFTIDASTHPMGEFFEGKYGQVTSQTNILVNQKDSEIVRNRKKVRYNN